MGWQSYFITYTGQDELNYISKVINEYQKIWNGEIETNEEIGEGIECICLAKIISQQFNNKQKYVLIFGIGGGRTYCENFFSSRNILLNYYESEIDEYLESKDKWYYHKEEYLPNDFSDQMYKNDFVNWFTNKQRKNVLTYIKKNITFWEEKISTFGDQELSEIHREIKKDKLEERLSKK